jgi:hypothetical protein
MYNNSIVMRKGNEMKVLYTSPVFKDSDGSARQVLIPLHAVETYAKRDAALLAMMALGGINAAPTAEFMAFRKTMMSAKRKIERNGWYCRTVV